MDYYRIDESTILNNVKIKIYLVDTDIDIYNDMARGMVNKIKENNEKGLQTSFIFPVGPKGQYKRFARICNLEGVSCENIISINMDEYLDENDEYIPMDNDLSFRGFVPYAAALWCSTAAGELFVRLYRIEADSKEVVKA